MKNKDQIEQSSALSKVETAVIEECSSQPENAVKQDEHEEKIEAVHHWIDDVFSQEQERLNKAGITDVKVWVKGMAAIDKAMSEYPLETLTYLAQLYGVSFPVRTENKEQIAPEIIHCLQNLEQNQKQLWQALETQSRQTKQLAVSSFVSAKDDEGNLLHPHFSVVKNEMFALLNSGIAFDFESAYEQALWINPQIRAELINEQSEQNLRHLEEEAEKAKSAGFSPRGRSEKEDFSRMTTREILEQKFKELGN